MVKYGYLEVWLFCGAMVEGSNDDNDDFPLV